MKHKKKIGRKITGILLTLAITIGMVAGMHETAYAMQIFAPTAKTGLVYNGTDQELLNKDGTASGGELQYALGEDDVTDPAGDKYAASIPTGINAGTYYVWYKVKGNDGQKDTDATCIEVSIDKAAGEDAIPVAETDFVYIYGNAIGIKGVEGQEYVIVPKGEVLTDDQWLPQNGMQIPNFNQELTFSGELNPLDPLTEYDIYTRVGETENTYSGAPVKTETMTALEGIGISSDGYYTSIVGETYTVETDPVDSTLSYQWYYYDGPVEFGDASWGTPAEIIPISGATEASYTVTDGDVGKYIGVKAFKNGKEVGAHWLDNPVQYGTVTFESNGGSEVASQTNLVFRDKVTKPADPTRSGYNFVGWYEDEEFEYEWNFETGIVEFTETTLFAKWEKKQPASTQKSNSQIDTSVKTDKDAPTVKAENLNETFAKSLLTKEELARYEAGEDIDVYLEVETMDASKVPAEDKSLAEKKTSELGGKVGMFLDLSLWKKIGNDNAQAIHDTNGKAVRITLTIPQDLRNTNNSVERTFHIIRIHDGKAEVLASTTGNSITFATDQFSTYTLSYVDKTIEKKTANASKDTGSNTVVQTSKTKTGDAGHMYLWIALIAAAAVGIGGLTVYGRRRHIK